MTTVNQPKVTHDGYCVLWSAEDEEFVGNCVEFPSLLWQATTQERSAHGDPRPRDRGPRRSGQSR